MLSGKGTILSTAGKTIGEQFEHAEWEGLRFYDLIFPLFIFVTGVAIARIGAATGATRANARWICSPARPAA